MASDDKILSQIALSHGQARWVLRHFNMSAGDSDASFNALLKSLRWAGVPFAPDEVGGGEEYGPPNAKGQGKILTKCTKTQD